MIFFHCEHKLTQIQMIFYHCEQRLTQMIFYNCEHKLNLIQMIFYHCEWALTYSDSCITDSFGFRWYSTIVSTLTKIQLFNSREWALTHSNSDDILILWAQTKQYLDSDNIQPFWVSPNLLRLRWYSAIVSTNLVWFAWNSSTVREHKLTLIHMSWYSTNVSQDLLRFWWYSTKIQDSTIASTGLIRFRWNSTYASPDLLEFRYSTTVSEPRLTQTEMIFYHSEPQLTRIRMICYRCEWAPAPSCKWLGRALWRRVPSDYWPCSNRSLNCRTWLEGLYSLCCLQASC